MNKSTSLTCAVCGHGEFVDHKVLWPDLIAEWQLSQEEVEYIDIQQGTCCTNCGANIRSIALAKAICSHANFLGTFDAYLSTLPVIKILEVNEAGNLHHHLKSMSNHVFKEFPECDLMALPFDDESFDLIIHSDTLEHIPNVATALMEMIRVLKKGGAAIFTTPLVINRLTRSRAMLSSSYHGDPKLKQADNLVYTEFGSNVWCEILNAGFKSCTFIPFKFPSGIAIIATK